MQKVTFEIDEETLSDLDALAAQRAYDRAGTVWQLIAEATQDEAETGEYDAWFREQVEEAIRESEEPDAEFIPHEQVMAEMRAELESRIALATKLAS